MGKAKKVSVRWIERVGSLVSEELARRYGRQFLYHQAGPYTQSKHPWVEVYFNEPQFRSLPSKSPTDKYDDRFGFVISNQFQKHRDEWVLFAGFHLRNKVIARSRFVPNLASEQDRIAASLSEWIEAAQEFGLSLSWDQLGRGRYIFELTHSFDDLVDALSNYADLDRKSSGIHSDDTAGWAGATFAALEVMPQFNGVHDDQSLFDAAGEVADSALTVFEKLGFLYDLLLDSTELRTTGLKAVGVIHDSPEDEETETDDLKDERLRRLALAIQRQGQPEFRKTLLRAYNGRCAISGCDVAEALQAAHIISYLGAKSNDCSNGILLRADIHNPFDLDLLMIDPETLSVSLAPKLRDSAYGSLEGVRVKLPECITEQPSRKALKVRFEQARAAAGLNP